MTPKAPTDLSGSGKIRTLLSNVQQSISTAASSLSSRSSRSTATTAHVNTTPLSLEPTSSRFQALIRALVADDPEKLLEEITLCDQLTFEEMVKGVPEYEWLCWESDAPPIPTEMHLKLLFELYSVRMPGNPDPDPSNTTPQVRTNLKTDLFLLSGEHGFVRVVKQLLEDPEVDVEFHRHKNNNTALIWASANGHVEVMKVFLASNRTDLIAAQESPHYLSCLFRSPDVVRLLLKDGRVDPSAHNNTALSNMCYFKNLKIVRMLLADKRVDPTEGCHSILMSACCLHGYHDVLNILLKDGRINPGAEGNSLIQAICEISSEKMSYNTEGYVETFRLLLKDSRVDPSANDQAALKNASKHGHVDFVRWLLLHPVVVVPKTVLIDANAGPHEEVTRLLRNFKTRPFLLRKIKWKLLTRKL